MRDLCADAEALLLRRTFSASHVRSRGRALALREDDIRRFEGYQAASHKLATHLVTDTCQRQLSERELSLRDESLGNIYDPETLRWRAANLRNKISCRNTLPATSFLRTARCGTGDEPEHHSHYAILHLPRRHPHGSTADSNEVSCPDTRSVVVRTHGDARRMQQARRRCHRDWYGSAGRGDARS